MSLHLLKVVFSLGQFRQDEAGIVRKYSEETSLVFSEVKAILTRKSVKA